MLFSDDLEEALGDFARDHGIDRDEALQRIVRAALINSGYLPSGEEGIPPEKLNASNDD
ncbi:MULTISPECIES: hypothetical protein [Rhizobium/Agrobacterium group]|uniref:hypothetical protein n=1 Tax=Rhizobium/Agrobacterium group TaxID=227290 RepID=UPI0022FFDFD7|nr:MULTISPECIES: hypothetical protein [Rhizobium/Agrobacterium group]MDA5632404.1 hypothetical protein [Agrobacterium sp. ST15.16.024]MDF1888267.1 hypothetical protein [Rhizobium rhizogenes]